MKCKYNLNYNYYIDISPGQRTISTTKKYKSTQKIDSINIKISHTNAHSLCNHKQVYKHLKEDNLLIYRTECVLLEIDRGSGLG